MTTVIAETAPTLGAGATARTRVLDAAVRCILERGYYHASSNAIAREAGVTWGTIQCHFGTREGLLLALLNERWRELQDDVANARIVGETLESRIRSVLDVLALHYAQPANLAHIQLLLDLSSDPSTTKATREAVAQHGAELTRAWQPLFEQALGERADDELVRFVFLALRGYLTGRLIASSIAPTVDDTVTVQLLVAGVAAAVEQRASSRKVVPG